MKKLVKFVLLPLVLLFIIAVIGVFVYLNRIVKHTVEVQATNSLNLQTTLDNADISLFGGKFALNQLQIASPQGFSADKMFSLGKVDLGVNYSHLRAQPIRLASITIEKPRLVIEQSGGKFNLQALMDQQSKSPAPEEGEPVKLIIDELNLSGAEVVILPGIPGLKENITIPIPAFKLQKVGTGEGNQNGAEIKKIIGEVTTALAAKASDSDALPPEVRQLLKLNVAQLSAQLGAEFNKQLGAISTDLNKAITDIKADPTKAGDALKEVQGNLKETGKDLEKNLGGLLGKEKKDGKKPEEK